MRTRLLTRSAAALMPALLLAPAASYGQGLRHVDPANDLTRLNTSTSHVTAVTSAAASPADIGVVGVRHRARAVTLVVHLARLNAPGSYAVYGTLVTPRARYDFQTGRDGTGTYPFAIGRGSITHSVRCHAAQRFNLDTGVVSIAIPRRCLGNPSWVRVGLGTNYSPPSGNSVDVDDAFRSPGIAAALAIPARRLRVG